jgi:hypothetical protein
MVASSHFATAECGERFVITEILANAKRNLMLARNVFCSSQEWPDLQGESKHQEEAQDLSSFQYPQALPLVRNLLLRLIHLLPQ